MSVVIHPGKSNPREIWKHVGLCTCGCQFIPEMWENDNGYSLCPECQAKTKLIYKVTVQRLISFDPKKEIFFGICHKCGSQIEVPKSTAKVMPLNSYGTQLVIIRCSSCNASNNNYFDFKVKLESESSKTLSMDKLVSHRNLQKSNRFELDLTKVPILCKSILPLRTFDLTLPTKFKPK